MKPLADAARREGSGGAWFDSAWRLVARYRYPLLVVVAVVLVAAGQLIEDAADGVLQMATPAQSVRRWTLVALVLYEFAMAAIVYRTVQRSLQPLRPVVKLDDEAFARYEREIWVRDWTRDLALLAVSAAVVVLIFLGLGLDLLDDDPLREQTLALPQSPVSAGLILLGYVIIGWAGLKLLYAATRFGRLLGRLSREPLEINVFDTTPLLPFGNIALAVALAPVGVIAILLVGLGAPSSLLGWTVLLLASVASLLALLLPLRGVHRQMSLAKDRALATVNERIGHMFVEVSRTPELDRADMARLSNSSGALIPLRKTIAEMPTWPFRDTLAFGRALLIAMAPLVYTTLSELIRVFLIAPLSR